MSKQETCKNCRWSKTYTTGGYVEINGTRKTEWPGTNMIKCLYDRNIVQKRTR